MSEFKGTPGPWRIARKREGKGFIESVGPCLAEEYAGSAWLGVSDEDANLIAAAPELLEALMDFTSLYPTDIHYDKDSLVGRARAAIAKALGEQK